MKWFDRFRVGSIQGLSSVTPHVDQANVPQYTKVLRDRRLPQAQVNHNVADRPLPRSEVTQYFPSAWLGHCIEGIRSRRGARHMNSIFRYRNMSSPRMHSALEWRHMKKPAAGKGRARPKLDPKMSVQEYKSYYWMAADLARFARQLGLRASGPKLKLSARIERRLRGLPDPHDPAATPTKGPRDSDRPLTRDTPVVNYKSDQKTRRFFEKQIGPEFHFTYHLNQWRLARRKLTYGDLVDEWVAERKRRRSEGYQAPMAEQGKYNRFIRDFFADKKNQGKSLGDAAAAWNAIKNNRGDLRYHPRGLGRRG